MNNTAQSKHTSAWVLVCILFILSVGLYVVWTIYYTHVRGSQKESTIGVVTQDQEFCELENCPIANVDDGTVNPETAMWNQIFSEETGLAFHYPDDFGSEYITTVDWPPTLQPGTFLYACEESVEQPGLQSQTYGKDIKGTYYCIAVSEEGAAGSAYLQYTYTFDYHGEPMALSFSIQKVQCGNYDEPKKQTCTQEQSAFDIDEIVNTIVESIE
ncbi:MAG: hypothetical protein CO030_04045 [Candidatus Magasanikbacteria bacterium CG_4_9_14_0_2_um_filter_42_11]|uniref:Uncharacterized protein n=1 Tax=Candidatus Magasanikbacteria bacterium CG_4_9_14_0_2_um_filter_42_11 TaxID=1974643 RepID=A0A2M8F961_9BACT|nr:MAG: hypothetical protein COU34_04260 [Candidatus Magasanikbacteria bacterium CG10_big_fil_rev_8_21_14_0_10_43_9]PIY92234.1 MAG: hypothetical protein COY70_04255 [Candidatus Magasanikbacteria bacterium CG_4_10_14_0_8_um_filter_42_12]PJC52263.1 MAG: hypothetical protein CO030_04045 [Candidatus Magasanikbacteria bacterium CG_4_9_14_0_2_um_filter_42_11]